jgi:hypothetical protein
MRWRLRKDWEARLQWSRDWSLMTQKKGDSQRGYIKRMLPGHGQRLSIRWKTRAHIYLPAGCPGSMESPNIGRYDRDSSTVKSMFSYSPRNRPNKVHRRKRIEAGDARCSTMEGGGWLGDVGVTREEVGDSSLKLQKTVTNNKLEQTICKRHNAFNKPRLAAASRLSLCGVQFGRDDLHSRQDPQLGARTRR